MIQFSVTEQPNSIEELFAKKFEELSKYPMDNNTSEIFVKLLLSRRNSEEIKENEKPNFYKLIENRISVVHDYQVDDRVVLFLCWICRTPQICVMYCWYLQYESKKHNTEKISFELFAEIFGSGFPSEEALNKMWMQQQVIIEGNNSDNLLDYPKAGLSLFKNYVYEAN